MLEAGYFSNLSFCTCVTSFLNLIYSPISKEGTTSITNLLGVHATFQKDITSTDTAMTNPAHCVIDGHCTCMNDT